MVKPTQTTGKEGELRVIGELLKKGLLVYTPLVDIVGIDCIIKTDVGYREIQVKTREFSKTLLFDVREFVPSENFFVICYNIKEPEVFWVLPSKVFLQNAYHLKKFGKFRLTLGDEDSKMRQKLHLYRNNFFQLKEGTKEATEELKKTIKTSGWQHLKKLYPTLKDINAKIAEAKLKGYSAGYVKILNNLKRYRERHG